MINAQTITRPRCWITPSGYYYNLFQSMAEQPHLLIAGATGSGKSVLVNGIICTLLLRCSPSRVRFILIDPKKTELRKYSALPHTLRYADTGETTLQALQYAQQITDARFIDMQRRGLTEHDGEHIYIIIDELAALMSTQKKTVLPILQYLGMVARAAHVHMIACTQTVKAEILPTQLTCNFDSRVSLRTSTAQQSRMIIDRAGCELFPSPKAARKAYCFFRTGADLEKYQIPMIEQSEIERLIGWWQSKQCIA